MKKLLVYLVLAMLVFAVGCDVNTKVDPPATLEPTTPSEDPTLIAEEKMPEGLFVDDIILAFVKAPAGEFNMVKPLEGEKVLKGGEAWEFMSYQDFSATGGKFSVEVKLSDAIDSDKAHIWIEFFDKKITVPDSWKQHAVLSEKADVKVNEYVSFTLDVDVPENVDPVQTKFKVELATEAKGNMTIKDVKFIPNDATKVNLLPFASFERNGLDGKWKVTDTDNWPDPVPEDVLKDGKNKAVKLNKDPKKTMTNLIWITDNGAMIPKDSELTLSMKVLSKETRQINCLLKESDENYQNYPLNIKGANKWQTVKIPSDYTKKLEESNFEVQLHLL